MVCHWSCYEHVFATGVSLAANESQHLLHGSMSMFLQLVSRWLQMKANTSSLEKAGDKKVTFKDVAGCDEAKVGFQGDHLGIG